MKNKKGNIVIALLIAMGASVILLIPGRQASEEGAESKVRAAKFRERPTMSIFPEPRHKALKVLMDWHNQPVTLYGKVVDQFGGKRSTQPHYPPAAVSA
jgi:hypothetical protein